MYRKNFLKKQRIFLFSLLFFVGLYHSVVFAKNNVADEHIVWQRAPINVTLPVGKERFVTFPEEVQFGYNTESLPPSVLRVENDHRTLYLLAKKSFSTQRVEAKLGNGDIILLDLSAKPQADDHPLDIVLPEKVSQQNQLSKTVHSAAVSEVSLMRYAIQQLYAPDRLLKQSTSITRFPMETAHLVPLFYDGSVSAMPLASWRARDQYVTAIFLKNLLHQSLRLDPRLLCGGWQAASFYPKNTLAPHGVGMNHDSSTLFVISNKPFSQAIQSCLGA